MKATGIVRRIDDLGRIVVPKEIRRTLRVKEGDPMEIYVDSREGIVLKKYSPVATISSFADEYAASINDITKCIVLITDRDSVVALAGAAKKDYLGKELGKTVEDIMQEGSPVVLDGSLRGHILAGLDTKVVTPILIDGVVSGSIIIGSKTPDYKVWELEIKISKVFANLFNRVLS